VKLGYKVQNGKQPKKELGAGFPCLGHSKGMANRVTPTHHNS